MKFIVLKNNLKEGLKSIERVGNNNLNLPILKNFLIESHDNKIKLAATDLELAVTGFISGKIIEKGGLTIPFNIFNSIINNLQTERINIEAKNNKLSIKTDNYSAEIQGIKKEEFPIIPQIENKNFYLEISGSVLVGALASVVGCAASGGRPELGGLLFDFQTTLLKLAATDGFRLSEKTIFNTQFKSNLEKNFKIIIPAKTIQEVIRELQKEESGENAKALIYFDPNQVLFKINDTEIVSRLINGDFPDYQPIIPKTTEIELILNKEQLINSLKLAGVFADRLNEIKIIIKENQKNIEVFSFNQNIGENNFLIPAKIKNRQSLPLEIVFNWRFLLEGIKGLETEEVFLGINGSDKPVLVKPVEDASWFYILMPIKS